MHDKVKSFQSDSHRNFANEKMEDLIRELWEGITSKEYWKILSLMIKDAMNNHEDYELDNLIAKPRVKENTLNLKLKKKIFDEYSSKFLSTKDIWNNNKISIRSIYNIIHEWRSNEKNENSQLNSNK